MEGRRDRNLRLIASLRDKGVDIELAEVERLGRTLTGPSAFRAHPDRQGLRQWLR